MAIGDHYDILRNWAGGSYTNDSYKESLNRIMNQKIDQDMLKRERLYGDWGYASTCTHTYNYHMSICKYLPLAQKGDIIDIFAPGVPYITGAKVIGIEMEYGYGFGCIYAEYMDYYGSGHDPMKTIKLPITDNSIGIKYIKKSSCEQNKQEEPKKMISLNTMMKKLLDKDTQTLIKAGYINGDLLLTDEGWQTLKTLLFGQFKDELVKLATEKLEEEKQK